MRIHRSSSRSHQCHAIFFPLLICVSGAAALEVGLYGSSSPIQDGLINRAPRECPIQQDGSTTDTFPWTYPPTCLPLILHSASGSPTGTSHLYCVYTNTEFNNGRGISIVTSVETAMDLGNEVYDAATGGLVEGAENWELKETDGKGWGLFAGRRIDAGESLIVKSPVLFISKDVLDSVSRARRRKLLEKAVEQLPEKTRKSVMALSRRGGESEVEDIINVNAVKATVWDGNKHLVIVPEAARINHACRPNAYYRFDDYTLNFDVFALNPIQPGEEITFSYGFSTEPHASRIAALKSTWGFTCTCPLCTFPPAILSASDARLSTISSLKSSLPTSLDGIPEYITILPQLISLLEEEGLATELPMYEEILAYSWSAIKQEEKARYWAGRATRHWSIIAGAESWEMRRTKDLEGGVRTHYTWGSWERGALVG